MEEVVVLMLKLVLNIDLVEVVVVVLKLLKFGFVKLKILLVVLLVWFVLKLNVVVVVEGVLNVNFLLVEGWLEELKRDIFYFLK